MAWFAPSNCDVLVLGMEGAGKTLLLRQLQRTVDKRCAREELDADVLPTHGVELLDIVCGHKSSGRHVMAREVGGSMQPLWSQYFADCRLVLFVIDVSSAATLAPAAVEMFALLRDEAIKTKPMLVVLNKNDLPCTLERVEINMLLGLHDLEAELRGRLSVLETSALTGTGCEAVLKWLLQPPRVAATLSQTNSQFVTMM